MTSKNQSTDRICKNCYYFVEIAPNMGYGDCRYNAPVLPKGWITLQDDFWCGKFKWSDPVALENDLRMKDDS